MPLLLMREKKFLMKRSSSLIVKPRGSIALNFPVFHSLLLLRLSTAGFFRRLSVDTGGLAASGAYERFATQAAFLRTWGCILHLRRRHF